MPWNKQSSLLLQITIFFSITLSSVILLAANSLKEQGLRIEADGIRGKIGEQALAEGSVSLEQGTIQLQAASMHIDWDEKDISLVTATGSPVKIEKMMSPNMPSVTARSEKVIFYPLEQMLILIGKANLKQDENTFVGHEIHYDLVTGELKAISGKGNNKRVEIMWNSDDGVGKH